MVPGQVIEADTIEFMRKLDVKEIHGYNAARGLKLIKLRPALGDKPRSKARKAGQHRRKRTHPANEGGSIMEAFFEFLAANPFILLFFTVGLAVLVGKFSSRATASAWWPAAIVVGAALSTWASTYGVKLQLDNFAKSLFYYLFMYGVGLRVGPSFINSLKRRRPEVHHPRRVCCGPRPGARRDRSPSCSTCRPGAAGGILAGSQTMSAAIGSAEHGGHPGRVQAARRAPPPSRSRR